LARPKLFSVLILAAVSAAAVSCGSEGAPTSVTKAGPVADWPEVGGDKGGSKYSPLSDITPENIDRLEVAWVHRNGDASDGTGEYGKTSFQTTPIVADDTLFFCTGFNRVIALDPETGEQRWSFDPELKAKAGAGPYPLTCRGVAYWKDPEADDEAPCAHRIFTGTRDSELIAVDARTGTPCADFGRGGRVALREGIGKAPAWEYYPTSPPIVVRNRVVVGALVADSVRVDAPSGVVRAFDARSGKLSWAWDPVPPGWNVEPGPDGRIYEVGTPNVWTLFAGDEDAGIVYVPTGNPSPDSFGGLRRGLDYYGSSVVALDAEDGEVRWHFQTVHNDVWDFDVASQPALFHLPGVGGGRPGLAQATKMGHIFLLDRRNGKPLYPVEERPVPQNGVPGEKLSATQPFPTHPEPIHPTSLTPDDAWGFTPFDKAYCADMIAGYRSEGIFTPPSLEGTVQYPSTAGGANWGGVSIDPVTGILYVNQMHAAMVIQLIPREEFDKLDLSKAAYPNELYPMTGTPYGVKRGPLLSNFGAPCTAPPWGTITAIDLQSGKVVWKSVLGTTRDQAPWPLWLDTGAPNLGGAFVTGGGVLFIAATTDKFFRGFDAATGEEIWRRRIPFTGNSTPVTYKLRPDSKQYVVLAAGGHGWSESGDALIAYALRD
jgi:quinoprotein glucose dehydrogenase